MKIQLYGNLRWLSHLEVVDRHRAAAGRHRAVNKVPVRGERSHPVVGKARGVADVPAHTAEVYHPGPCFFSSVS